MAEQPIYNLCRRADWEAALVRGEYRGSADDRRDGFIHFSTAQQVRESAARHRAGVPDLLLLAVDPHRSAPRSNGRPRAAGRSSRISTGPCRCRR
jgi:uncharacterized protein (DUF952 family)